MFSTLEEKIFHLRGGVFDVAYKDGSFSSDGVLSKRFLCTIWVSDVLSRQRHFSVTWTAVTVSKWTSIIPEYARKSRGPQAPFVFLSLYRPPPRSSIPRWHNTCKTSRSTTTLANNKENRTLTRKLTPM